jgi:DnaK suppressor protein
MPSKKTQKAQKKPGKAAPKAAAQKKIARPPTKAASKPVIKTPATKAKVKSSKPPQKPTTAKTPVAKPPSVKARPVKAAEPAKAAPKAEPKSIPPRSAPIKFDIRPLVMPRSPLAEDGADSDSPLSASLLAGPRNVKPYIARRGEQYMNKEQLEHFARILQNWKRDLMVEVDRTVLHMKDEAANFPDPNDRATQEEEFSLELRTRDRERKLIRKIDEALKRIEDGSYGYCLETGEEIGIKPRSGASAGRSSTATGTTATAEPARSLGQAQLYRPLRTQSERRPAPGVAVRRCRQLSGCARQRRPLAAASRGPRHSARGTRRRLAHPGHLGGLRFRMGR